MSSIIKNLFYGQFTSQHFAESLDVLSLDAGSLEKQIFDSVNGNGNLEEPFDVYHTIYIDDSSTLLFLYPIKDGGYGLGGTTLYKMRQYNDPGGTSYIYNDCNPSNPPQYTATLSVSKEKANDFGHIMIYKQSLRGTCVRLVGALLEQVSQEEIQGTDIHNAIVNRFHSAKFMEFSSE